MEIRHRVMLLRFLHLHVSGLPLLCAAYVENWGSLVTIKTPNETTRSHAFVAQITPARKWRVKDVKTTITSHAATASGAFDHHPPHPPPLPLQAIIILMSGMWILLIWEPRNGICEAHARPSSSAQKRLHGVKRWRDEELVLGKWQLLSFVIDTHMSLAEPKAVVVSWLGGNHK